MKKVIALSLALVLALSMATVAFAAVDYTNGAPKDGSDARGLTKVTAIKPGSEIKFDHTDFKDAANAPASFGAAFFTSDYFAVSKVKYNKGAAMVESLKFDGDGKLVLTLKKNYALESTEIANFGIETLDVKSIKEAKTGGTVLFAKSLTYSLITPKDLFVGYDSTLGTLVEKKLNKVDSADATFNGVLYKFKKAESASGLKNELSYKDIAIRGAVGYVEVRVFDKEALYLEESFKADTDIVKAYPDAELDFVSFVGAPEFTSNAKVEISADEGDFLYEIKDGKITATNFKWDSSAYAFTGKTRTLGKYVISDVELKAVAATDGGKNPNTGR